MTKGTELRVPGPFNGEMRTASITFSDMPSRRATCPTKAAVSHAPPKIKISMQA
jgi:hypothetical protein